MNTTDPPSGWRRWWLGVRPPTLGLSLVPVLLGTALGVRLEGTFDPASFLVAAFCVLCIQAGTNLFNDAGDGARGADGADRLGPVRLVGSGLAAVAEVRRAARLCFVLALAGVAPRRPHLADLFKDVVVVAPQEEPRPARRGLFGRRRAA